MPPRWPRQPTRQDPAFRKLDDRMTFATHVALFSASNSGLWFFELLNRRQDAWLPGFSLVWLGLLVLHGLYVFAIADYSANDYTWEDYGSTAYEPAATDAIGSDGSDESGST